MSSTPSTPSMLSLTSSLWFVLLALKRNSIPLRTVFGFALAHSDSQKALQKLHTFSIMELSTNLYHQVLVPFFLLYKSLTNHPEVWNDFEPRWNLFAQLIFGQLWKTIREQKFFITCLSLEPRREILLLKTTSPSNQVPWKFDCKIYICQDLKTLRHSSFVPHIMDLPSQVDLKLWMCSNPKLPDARMSCRVLWRGGTGLRLQLH